MKAYEEQYFFIRKPRDNGLPSLRPDLDTSYRNHKAPPQPGTKPYFFENALAEFQDIDNIPWPVIPPDILIGGGDIIVNSRIREALIEIDLPNIFIFPSVYIHNDGEWYEDYWYIGFLGKLDCWDRSKSTFTPDVVPDGLHSVDEYVLNQELLEQIELKNRLLFKMGGTDDAFITCHEKLMPLFRGDGESGAWLQKISEY